MTPLSPPRVRYATRRLGPVPWFHDGCRGLTVRAAEDVPSFDDQMIRGALARGAFACSRVSGLDRAINRELWSLGYVARLEIDQPDRPSVLVEVASGR
jgi:hypothetical protein